MRARQGIAWAVVILFAVGAFSFIAGRSQGIAQGAKAQRSIDLAEIKRLKNRSDSLEGKYQDALSSYLSRQPVEQAKVERLKLEDQRETHERKAYRNVGADSALFIVTWSNDH